MGQPQASAADWMVLWRSGLSASPPSRSLDRKSRCIQRRPWMIAEPNARVRDTAPCQADECDASTDRVDA